MNRKISTGITLQIALFTHSRKISEGMKQDGFRKGTEIYHISWPGYSAATASWEPRSNVGLALIEEWEASLEAEVELDAEEARELEEEDMEDE